MANMRPLLGVLVLVLCFGDGPAVCQAGTTIKTRTVYTQIPATPNVQNPNVRVEVTYRRGTMRRKDSVGEDGKPFLATIANCETKMGFLIDLDKREYRTYKLPTFSSEAQLRSSLQKNSQTAVQIESRTVDTGERKVFFGFLARHFVTTLKRSAGMGGGGGEEVIDGWYIDHVPPDDSCAPDYVHTEPFYVLATVLAMYPEFPQFQHTGPLPTGLALKETRTVHLAGSANGVGARTVTFESTVENLLDSPLSSPLFELPTGYHNNPQLFRGDSTVHVPHD